MNIELNIMNCYNKDQLKIILIEYFSVIYFMYEYVCIYVLFSIVSKFVKFSDSLQNICHSHFFFVRIGVSKSGSIVPVKSLLFNSSLKSHNFLHVCPVNDHSKVPGIFDVCRKVRKGLGEDDQSLDEYKTS